MGNAALDKYESSGGLSWEERLIVRGFLDSNQDDTRLAVQKTVQGNHAEMLSVLPGVGLVGGKGGGGSPFGAKGRAFAGKNIDDLSNAGKLLDPADKSGQLSLAGRALQKHGSREGSAFPSVKGSPSEINAQAQKIADEILNNPAATATYKDTGRFGKVMDVIAPDGRGLRYDSKGKFIGLLEPPKP
ncbi:hypothetical protein DYL61_23945 [Pseudomonas nabeulensis]|uniref:Uncharacterized protein n=2 Tax=Pseudomonas nabeulensis TaxID=2293833 RepID=A0A4Z0AP96_9PSED|nr:hypothetical protein DYL61_23945 [Pseudomonas nabeulensis]